MLARTIEACGTAGEKVGVTQTLVQVFHILAIRAAASGLPDEGEWVRIVPIIARTNS